MSDNKITQDQLEPNVMEELESGIGDLSTLSTENKDSLVAAVTEIYGKNVIAEAIGEPLAVTDTFTEMGSEINSLLSSFKTNMMNSGVTVESGDKFKQLIEKIKGLTEGEGNKGVQYANGDLGDISSIKNETVNVSIDDLGFNPTVIFFTCDGGGSSVATYKRATVNSILSYSEETACALYDTSNYKTRMYITNISSTGFDLTYLYSGTTKETLYNCSWYAIGIGEEDTTLRDSLANILQDAGVEVTEEDDMASLISKVDQKFDESGGLDIITATELPSTGKEGQICVVMENPIDNYAIISPGNSIIPDSSVVLRYNTKTPNYTFQFGNQLLSYNFYSTSFNGTVYPSYYWENSSWNLLTQSYVPIVENGVTPVPGNSLTLNTSSNYFIFTEAGDEDCLIVPDSFDYNHLTTTTTPIDFGLYNKVEVDARVLSQGTKTCYIGRSDTARTAQQTTSVVASYCSWHSQGVQISSTTTTTYTFDISEATGTGYLLFYSSNVAVQLAIVNIRLYP